MNNFETEKQRVYKSYKIIQFSKRTFGRGVGGENFLGALFPLNEMWYLFLSVTFQYKHYNCWGIFGAYAIVHFQYDFRVMKSQSS